MLSQAGFKEWRNASDLWQDIGHNALCTRQKAAIPHASDLSTYCAGAWQGYPESKWVLPIHNTSPVLAKKALISADWGPSENNRKAKFYELTTAGRKQLEAERKEWERFSGAVALILRDA